MSFVIEEVDSEAFPTGRVDGVSEKGKTSVRVYDLNRKSLVKRRRKNQVAAIKALKAALAAGRRAFEAEWRALFEAEQEHSAAVRAACRRFLEIQFKSLKEATDPTRVKKAGN